MILLQIMKSIVFGNILELVPKAKKIKKLKGICVFCYKSASFSKKLCES